jgi:hypothetical protein
MAQPTDKDDALLLEELMNGPPAGNEDSSTSSAATAGAAASGGFSAQWSAMLANTKQQGSDSSKIHTIHTIQFSKEIALIMCT